jgi:hypothetical protein
VIVVLSRDHAAGDEFDGRGDPAGLREQQREQNEDLHGSGLSGRSGAEQYADEGSRKGDEADGSGRVQIG